MGPSLLLHGLASHWPLHCRDPHLLPPKQVICEGLAGQGLGVAISAATKDEKIAFALAPMVGGGAGSQLDVRQRACAVHPKGP